MKVCNVKIVCVKKKSMYNSNTIQNQLQIFWLLINLLLTKTVINLCTLFSVSGYRPQRSGRMLRHACVMEVVL